MNCRILIGAQKHDKSALQKYDTHRSLSMASVCGRTGEVLSPPAYEPLPTFPVRVHDGTVQVRDPRGC